MLELLLTIRFPIIIITMVVLVVVEILVVILMSVEIIILKFQLGSVWSSTAQ